MPALQTPEWVEARDYQQDAVNAWLENGRGVLQMATGTGKTVTSLLAAAEVAERLNGNLALVIAVPYQHLVDQWAADVRDYNASPVLAYESRANWQERLEGDVVEFNHGASDGFVVITTHTTFATPSFQRIIGRLRRQERMLIADEVHHMGAPHLQASLPESFQLRLGLSATPKRFFDDEGTEALFDYFGEVVFEYMLKEAIANGALCEYYYIPHVVELTDEEAEEYFQLSRKIARLIQRTGGGLSDADTQGNTQLKFALFERARLIGTAENKLVRLVELMQTEAVRHTLVYCGDGTVEGSVSSNARRHVDAVLSTLRSNLGIRAERFTADESRSERQELLTRFDEGDVEALVAIRCLDEGVDVPATETAYMLASSSNPRQFVQRRGRILRTHSGKSHATIHDFIVVPPLNAYQFNGDHDDIYPTERNLVRKELERVNLFAEAALNHPAADVAGFNSDGNAIRELKRTFNLRNL